MTNLAALPIFDHLAIFDQSGHFQPFWSFSTISVIYDHFGQFSPLWTILTIFRSFSTIFDHFPIIFDHIVPNNMPKAKRFNFFAIQMSFFFKSINNIFLNNVIKHKYGMPTAVEPVSPLPVFLCFYFRSSDMFIYI